MILKFGDGSQLNLKPAQFENFSFLNDVASLSQEECLLLVMDLDPPLVRDVFAFHDMTLSKETRHNMFYQKVHENTGYARDFVSLCIYFGYNGSDKFLSTLIESMLQTQPNNVIQQAFGL